MMKTKEQMLTRYNILYDKMVSSKDPSKMKIFGESEKYVFKEVASKLPELADSWLSHLEQTDIYNFLSEHEMNNVSKRIINQDGSRGFKWSYSDVEKALSELNGNIEDLPYYNSYALVTTMNMIYSDHARSISEDLGIENPKDLMRPMAISCYRKALEKLKDMDRPYFVRDYFKGQMYDDSPMPK